MTPRRLLLYLAMAIVLGLAVFALTVARVTTVERLGSEAARVRFDAVRARLGGQPAWVRIGSDGKLLHELPPADADRDQRPDRLRVLAYRGPAEGLVEADIPFWFVRLKEPALRYVLRETGIDFDDWGVTAAELARRRPGLVLDVEDGHGDRFLVWTERSGP